MWNFKNTLTGTLTGVRISAVDGTAFLDNCSALLPYMDGRSRIQILDASGRILEGVLGLRGVDEEVGLTNLIGTIDFTSGWTTSGVTIDGPQAEHGNNSTTLTKNNIGVTTMLCLYKLIWDFSCTGSISISTNNAGRGYCNLQIPSGELYFNKLVNNYNNEGICFINWSNPSTILSITTFTMQQVLTPSNQGCIIKNDAGVQNFIAKNASFTYNAASYSYRVFTDTRI